MTKAALVLLLPAILAAQDTGSISGIVRDSDGETLAGITLRLRGPERADRTTNALGEYEFEGLPAGSYGISAAQPPIFVRRFVSLASDQKLEKIDFRIDQIGVIQGRVLDDNGEPMTGVSVYLVGTEYRHGRLRHTFRDHASTDDRGEYRLERPIPGVRYALMAKVLRQTLPAISDAPSDPKARRPAFQTTFYPSSPAIDGAQHLILGSGQELEGMDIRMRRSESYCISGVLQAAGAPAALTFEFTELQPSSGRHSAGGMFSRSPSGQTRADGRFRICDLARGQYRLLVRSLYGGPATHLGATDIAVVDEDVDELRVSAEPLVEAPGEAAWVAEAPDEPSSPELRVVIRPVYRAGSREEHAGATSTVPGEFAIPNLGADAYELQVLNLADDWYVADIRYGDRSIANDVLRVGSARPDSKVRISIGHDGARIEASVRDEDGEPVPDIDVYILPESAASEAALAGVLLTGRTNQLGRYESGALRPGAYRVLATRTSLDRSPESIRRLWQARREAAQVELGPSTVEAVEIELLSL